MAEYTYGTAACVLLVDASGNVLAVSRKGSRDDFGIPGGKREPGETYEEAAIRELSEETGVCASNLKKLFEGPCRSTLNKDEFNTVTFVADYVGTPTSSLKEGTRTEWVPWERLFAGPFGPYNRVLHDAYVAMKRDEGELRKAV